MSLRATIVVDLGFGDAGKGLVTDYLVRRHGSSMVVRFNGGAQAGHNVVTPDGRHHTFAQVGAGTFVEGVRTWIAREVVVHPTALVAEARALRAVGVTDALARLSISDEVRIVTPYHQAANRIRELVRGRARHGSCGVGIGETVADALSHPDEAIVGRDLLDPRRLRRKLVRTAERKRVELTRLVEHVPDDPSIAQEWRVFAPAVLEAWLELVEALRAAEVIVPDEALREALAGCRHVVFEGAQGVLLDERFGFHPHTTWSRCTFEPALELLASYASSPEVTRLGLLRSHVVRHGPGPLPTQTTELDEHIREHNHTNPWQGAVRYGWFDVLLARYALEVTGDVDGLVLTHADLLDACRRWRASVGYHAPLRAHELELVEQRGDDVVRLRPPTQVDLDRQARLSRLLERVTPKLDDQPTDEASMLESIECGLRHPIVLLARGQRAADVHERT